MTDLEAVAGVVSFQHQTYDTGRYYDNAKRLLTAEVNAAVDGLLDMGATDILVADGHGYGGIWFEDLHPAAKLMHGQFPSARVFIDVARGYDVAMMIGQHAMAGVVTGNLHHTGSSKTVDWVKINGRMVGEMAEFALGMGALDIPLIFLSGDDETCDEARQFIPEIHAVSVKKGLGRHAAISVSAHEARRRIREGVVQAVRRHREHPMPPLKWPGPYVRETRYFTTDIADSAAHRRNVERVDGQTVRVISDNVLDVLWS